MATAPDALATAVAHFEAGRVEEALALAVRHEIENALGTEHARRGDREGAERHYREAILRAPGFFKPHNNLGNVLRERGQLEAAVEAYRAALAIEPSAQRVHANLGNTLSDLGLWACAVESYETAVALGAGPPIVLRLGETLEALGDPEHALLAYAKAAALGETTAAARQEQLRLALQKDPLPAPAHAPKRAKRRSLVEAAGDELSALLAPVSPATFVHRYWAQKPLLVKGFAEKYQGFFDGAAFIEAVGKPGPSPSNFVRASFDKRVPAPSPAGAPESATVLFPITPEQAGVLHDAGATICLTEVETRVPRLASFAAAVKRQLGYPGKVAFNAYASPAGAGFNWHFDARIACTLQIEGTKRWRFSRSPTLPWPRGNGQRLTDGSARYGDPTERADWEHLDPLDENAITTVLLEPGDLLILPAGVWHDACGGATGSLALNLAFLPFSHTRLVEEILSGLLDHDAAWRSASPLLPTPGDGPGAVDAAGLDALRRQLEKAGEALRSLAADSTAPARAWASFVQNQSPLASAPKPPPRAPLAPADRLRVRADGDVYVQSVEGGAKLLVSVGSRPGMEVAGVTMRLLQRALSAREMVAGDCLAWCAPLAWAEVEQMLAYFVDEGLLERVAA